MSTFSCPYCGAEFTSTDTLRAHLEYTHIKHIHNYQFVEKVFTEIPKSTSLVWAYKFVCPNPGCKKPIKVIKEDS